MSGCSRWWRGQFTCVHQVEGVLEVQHVGGIETGNFLMFMRLTFDHCLGPPKADRNLRN